MVSTTTLHFYLSLGRQDVLHLQSMLEEHVEDGHIENVLIILRRLAAMPCTKKLLESTMIGATVGRHRRHAA